MSTDGYTNDTENATVTTTTTPSEFEGREVNHKALWLVFVPCAWMQSVVGSIGTLMVLVLICMQPKISNHELFIANLATTDLITLAYWWPFFCLDLVLGHHPVLNMTHCRINGFLITLMSEVYVVSLIFVSINRYMHVCHYARYTKVFTTRNTKLMIACIWLSAFVFGIPQFVFWGKSFGYEAMARICTMTHDTHVLPLTLKFMYVVAPLTLIGYLNFSIYRFWGRASKNLQAYYEREETEFKLYRDFRGRSSLKDVLDLHRSNNVQSIVDKAAMSKNVIHEGFQDPHKKEPKGDDASLKESLSTSIDVSHNVKEVSVDFQPEKAATKEDGTCVITSNQPIKAEPSTYSDVPASGMSSKEGTKSAIRISITPAMSDSTKSVNGRSNYSIERSLEPVSERKPLGNPFTKNRVGAAAVGAETEGGNDSVTHLRSKSELQIFSKVGKSGWQQLNTPLYEQISNNRMVKQKSQERSVVRSLLIVYLMTCLSFAPYGITVIVDAIIGVTTELMVSVHLLVYMNNASNWILYGYMNPVFRRRCIQLIISVYAKR